MTAVTQFSLMPSDRSLGQGLYTLFGILNVLSGITPAHGGRSYLRRGMSWRQQLLTLLALHVQLQFIFSVPQVSNM